MFKKLFKLLNADLRLFDGEAGGSAAGAGADQGSAAANSQAASKSGKPPVVMYGKQADPAPAAAGNAGEAGKTNTDPAAASQSPFTQDISTMTADQKKELYQRITRGDLKDIFVEDTQSIINKRFKEVKSLETRLGTMQPLIDLLMDKHGAKDLNDLVSKVTNESIEELADKAGMTVEQYKEVQALKSENKQLKTEKSSTEEQKAMDQKVAGWFEQATAMKGTAEKPGEYPEFDLKMASYNDEFMKLLDAGVQVKAAYEVCFPERLQTRIAKGLEKNITENIKAKGQRPAENGTTQTPGVIVKKSTSQLTKKERADLARRTAMGERFEF